MLEYEYSLVISEDVLSISSVGVERSTLNFTQMVIMAILYWEQWIIHGCLPTPLPCSSGKYIYSRPVCTRRFIVYIVAIVCTL